jgi:hypothetical protein
MYGKKIRVIGITLADRFGNAEEGVIVNPPVNPATYNLPAPAERRKRCDSREVALL